MSPGRMIVALYDRLLLDLDGPSSAIAANDSATAHDCLDARAGDRRRAARLARRRSSGRRARTSRTLYVFLLFELVDANVDKDAAPRAPVPRARRAAARRVERGRGHLVTAEPGDARDATPGSRRSTRCEADLDRDRGRSDAARSPASSGEFAEPADAGGAAARRASRPGPRSCSCRPRRLEHRGRRAGRGSGPSSAACRAMPPGPAPPPRRRPGLIRPRPAPDPPGTPASPASAHSRAKPADRESADRSEGRGD